jgi:hypothetical protein
MKKPKPPDKDPKDQDPEIEYMIADKMPTWMRHYLANEGISREFAISDLTRKQRNAFDLACHFEKMRKQGLFEIEFNPKINQDPIITATEKFKKQMYGAKTNKPLSKSIKEFKILLDIIDLL